MHVLAARASFHSAVLQKVLFMFSDQLLAFGQMVFSLFRHDFISPFDDLAFDMYQDPEVAQIIRKLDLKKQEAVTSEFAFADYLQLLPLCVISWSGLV